MKFVLLHESRNDDGIKAFFADVWELYVKVSRIRTAPTTVPGGRSQSTPNCQTMLNPFHTAHTPIRSAVFDSRVRASAKKYL